MEKHKDKIAGGLFVVFAMIAMIKTDSVLLSMLFGGVCTVSVAAIAYLFLMAKNLNGKENRRSKIKLIAAATAILLCATVIFIFLISSFSPKSRDMCINCGKNPMYTETGFCYDCYKSVKDSYSE